MMHPMPAGVLVPQRSDPTARPSSFSIILVGLPISFGLFYVCSICVFVVGVRPRSTELSGQAKRPPLLKGRSLAFVQAIQPER